MIVITLSDIVSMIAGLLGITYLLVTVVISVIFNKNDKEK